MKAIAKTGKTAYGDDSPWWSHCEAKQESFDTAGAAVEQGNAMCKEKKLCSSRRRSMTT